MPTLHFPFGQPIRPVAQTDRSRKRVFVLGVYASAVHAHWKDDQGRTLVRALAVASEPCIFWTGEGAADIIRAITFDPAAGSLESAGDLLNGPSGRTLDQRFLAPIGLTRSDAWLCDLLPESRLNQRQIDALQRASYDGWVEKGVLPRVDYQAAAVPPDFLGSHRPEVIQAEIAAAEPEILVTLGDQPLKDLVGPLAGLGPRTLRSFGADPGTYGRLHPITLGGRRMMLLPLVHPRQAGALGRSTPEWRVAHDTWAEQTAPALLP